MLRVQILTQNHLFHLEKNKGEVDLFIVDKDLKIPGNLTLKQFITVLEQYLIIKLKPTLNKKLLATPGIMWSPSTIKNFLEKISHSIYVYHKQDNGELILIQIFPSTRVVGISLGFRITFIKV